MDETTKFTVAIGDAFSGITLRGIFETAADAADYGETECVHATWSVVPIEEE